MHNAMHINTMINTDKGYCNYLNILIWENLIHWKIVIFLSFQCRKIRYIETSYDVN